MNVNISELQTNKFGGTIRSFSERQKFLTGRLWHANTSATQYFQAANGDDNL